MAGTCAADPDQHLPWPRFGHRHVPKLARLLPFDELKGLDSSTSFLPSLRSPQFLPVASLALVVLDPVELDFEMQRTAEHLVQPVGRRVDEQPRVLDAPQKRLQCDVDFQAR
jgi:hypothetical protein